MDIRLILSFCRSGSTLISRCIKSMHPNCVLLSEIHPEKAGLKQQDFHYQLTNWENIDIPKGLSYASYLEKSISHCEKNNKDLIIRDFSEADFSNKTVPHQLTHLEHLKTVANVMPIAIIRDPIDIFISQHFNPHFFENYTHFLHLLQTHNIPIIKYESFCLFPEDSMKRISEILEIPFSTSYQNFHTISKMTGDNNYPNNRGSKETVIQLQNRKKIPRIIQNTMLKNDWLKKCQKLGSYDPSYYSRPLTSSPSQSWINLKFLAKSIIKPSS